MDENHGDNHGLRVQPHGGALRNGGTNKGGTGRPKSEIRERCTGAFDERIAVLQEIADNKEASAADRLKAVDLLGKYGGLQQVDLTSGDKPTLTDSERVAEAAALFDLARERAAGLAADVEQAD